jgi:hypothetical protein
MIDLEITKEMDHDGSWFASNLNAGQKWSGICCTKAYYTSVKCHLAATKGRLGLIHVHVLSTF